MRPPEPSVSVVVPARNAASTIGAQVRALLEPRSPVFDVTVVDDASTDDTVTAARRAAHGDGRCRVISLPARSGPSAARNAGVAACAGQLVAFTDGDDLVWPGWIDALVRAARHADVVGGQIDDVALNTPAVRRRRPPHPAERLPEACGSIQYALGTNLAVWRDALDALGGWSESVPAGTDVDLCARAHLAGLTIGFAPGATVSYRIPDTWRGLIRQNHRWGRADAKLLRAFGPRLGADQSVAARIAIARSERGKTRSLACWPT